MKAGGSQGHRYRRSTRTLTAGALGAPRVGDLHGSNGTPTSFWTARRHCLARFSAGGTVIGLDHAQAPAAGRPDAQSNR